MEADKESAPAVTLTFTAELLKAVDDFRYAKRIPSRSEAARRLMERGLEAERAALP